MGDKQKLLREADEAHGELREAINGLDDEQLGRVWLGTWGVREILIHIAGWHREMIPALQRLGRGEPPHPEGVSYDDVDAWNARFVEARRDAKLADVLTELDGSYWEFVSVAAALEDRHFEPGAPARDLFDGAGPQHYREHAAQILHWRGLGRG